MTSKNANPHYAAQDILSRRNHSEFELRQKMVKKGFFREDIDETVGWLKSKKYLNDEKMARSFIEATLATKAVGPMYISFKLKQKKIASDIIQALLGEMVDKEKETELIQRAAASWRRSHPKHAQDKMRLARFLLSRGFSSSLLEAVNSQSD